VSRYARATEIMLAALDLAPADRPSFVVQQSNGDDDLQKDVLSLLAAHAKDQHFLETPANVEHAGLLDGGRPDVLPAAIGQYRIAGLLGEGGMGVVYLAEDTRLGRTVALKAIAPQFTHDPGARERLRREARAAAALSHPGIATVYALEEIDDRLYIAAEHIPGVTLRDAIANAPLPLNEVLAIGRRLADALAAAHDHGVIHRDLKPENVMRTPDGSVKILDFGLAKALDANAAGAAADGNALSVPGAIFGTPAYMSPEQLRGDAAGAASDIFALGVLLAEISSGRHPFGGERGTATMARVLSAEPDLAGVPPVLQPVITGCVAKAADDRFRSAHEVRAAIDTVARGETPRLGDRAAAFWWWQFHQAGASVFSIALAVSIWLIWGWLPRNLAPPLLVAAIVGGFGAATLRLHQWFSSRMLPPDAVTRRVSVGARANDLILAAASMISGLLIQGEHPAASGFLLAAAVVMMLISFVVEPATARAANR